MKKTDLERFEEKYEPEPNTGCWIWLGYVGKKNGYGYFSQNGKKCLAHRFSYEQFVGPIPKGLDLDHKCRNRWCCSPAHLEPVTRMENILRGESFIAKKARQTHCDEGHEFSPENTGISVKDGYTHRRCLTCSRSKARVRMREYYRKKREMKKAL